MSDYCTSDWISTVDDDASMTTTNSYFAKANFRSAYRSVRIYAASQKVRGLKWNFDNKEIYLKGTKVPFGAKPSLRIFRSQADTSCKEDDGKDGV